MRVFGALFEWGKRGKLLNKAEGENERNFS